MPPTASSDSVRNSIRRGDLARRWQTANLSVRRFLPWSAALAALLTALAAVTGGPRLVGLLLLPVVCAVVVAVFVAARRDRAVSDADAAELDQRAALGGALSSAYWFSEPSRAIDDPFVAFHIEKASTTAAGVDWTSVFPAPSLRATWGLTGTFGLATVAAFLWASPPQVASPFAATADVASAGVVSGPMPVTLVAKVAEGMRAMKSGKVPTKEALAAVGEALELAKADPELQRQLDRMFDDTAYDGEMIDYGGLSPEEYDMRGESFANDFQTSPQSLQWAFKEAASRAPAETPEGAPASKDDVEAADPARNDADGASGEGKADEAGSSDPAAAPPSDRAKPESFSALLFGRQPSADGAKAGIASAPTARAALDLALRREVVRARADAAGASVTETTSRRATNSTLAGTGRTEAGTGNAYDRVQATRPPAVPEARRTLVHDVFLRPPVQNDGK